MKAANPDVVFFGGYYEQAGRLKKQLSDAGVDASSSAATARSTRLRRRPPATPPRARSLSCPCYFASEAGPGKIGEFAKAYEEINGTVPGTYSTEAYDAANILMAGIKAGNDGPCVAPRLRRGPHEGRRGHLQGRHFEDNGNIEAQGIFVFEVKDGEIVLERRHRRPLASRGPSHGSLAAGGRPSGALLCDGRGSIRSSSTSAPSSTSSGPRRSTA